MKRHWQWLRFSTRQLGLLGWVGVALLLGSLCYGLVVVPQRHVESDALRKEIAQLRQDRLALLRVKAASADRAASAPLELPTTSMTPEILLTLEDIARQDGLQIKRNDYRYVEPAPSSLTKARASSAESSPAGGRLLEVKIVTPATGSYRNVRTFLSHVLEKVPALALDDMSLKREAIAGGDLQAQLRFTLFVRGGA